MQKLPGGLFNGVKSQIPSDHYFFVYVGGVVGVKITREPPIFGSS